MDSRRHPMSAPTVFISYSHKDEAWKDRLVTQLKVLQMEKMLDVWEDRQIAGGDDWQPEIEKAIERASVAIFLISADFLTSGFIRDEEVPQLLERRQKQGLRIIPLILRPCAWQRVKWLSSIQARPKDGRPLSGGSDYQIEADLAALANEAAEGGPAPAPVAAISRISLAKLPTTSPDLFGRERELDALDHAWDDPGTNVVTLVAWGGVGKTALVNAWLNRMQEKKWRGAERVYGWSFYREGAADLFFATALDWFGDPDPNQGSPWDKGERLADLVRRQRTLLVLDGLEPLQFFPGGALKDPGLQSLLRELAHDNAGLCAVTTRLEVDDLKGCAGVERIDLENLAPEDGARYLQRLGVKGRPEELCQPSTPALWMALDGFLLKPWQHPLLGPVNIHAVCIDSGGHFTQAVCDFCEHRRGRRVWAIKGMAGARPVWPRRQSKAAKGKVYVIGVHSCKMSIQQRLKLTEGPGCIHFAAIVDLPFFEQMTSEFMKTEYRRGRPERSWERRKGRAAEALDCAVYALAAIHGLASHGVSLDMEAERVALLCQNLQPVPVATYQVYRSQFMRSFHA